MLTSTVGRIFLIASAVFIQPAMADGFPDRYIPDPGKNRQEKPESVKATPSPGGSGVMTDFSGQPYTAQDVKYGYNPVPYGMRRSGGGFVRVWNGAPAGFNSGIGSMAYAVRLAQQKNDPIGPQLPPNLPERPENPENPENPDNPNPPNPPIKTDNVPGPLGIFGAGAAFMYSRKLRRRINGQ